MKILIVEPYASGHHASYLLWLLNAAARMGWHVVIATTPAALSHPALSAIGANAGIDLHVIKDLPRVDVTEERTLLLMRREFAYWRIFRALTARLRTDITIDAVVLPYVDYCFYALAILGSPFLDLPWCAVSMRLQAIKPISGDERNLPFKWRLAKRILREPHLRALFSINPSVQDLPSCWLAPPMLSKLRYLPDPADHVSEGSREKSRASLGITGSQLAILVFGSLDERKGIDALLAALAKCAEFENYVVVLAGKQSLDFRRQIVDGFSGPLSARRLVVIDHILTGEEVKLVVAASDLVWVGYRRHVYMSGVLALAGRSGLPVIGTAEGEIGRLIALYGLGVAVRIDRPEEVESALRSMLDACTRMAAGNRSRSLFVNHTPEKFGASILNVLDR